MVLRDIKCFVSQGLLVVVLSHLWELAVGVVCSTFPLKARVFLIKHLRCSWAILCSDNETLLQLARLCTF